MQGLDVVFEGGSVRAVGVQCVHCGRALLAKLNRSGYAHWVRGVSQLGEGCSECQRIEDEIYSMVRKEWGREAMVRLRIVERVQRGFYDPPGY